VVHFFGVSSLLSESVQMYMYIMRKLMRFREKSDIKCLFWKDRLVPRPVQSYMYEELPVVFISARAVQSWKVSDFLIVLQGK